MKNITLTFLCLIGFAATGAQAFDAPYGSDALFFQLRAGQHAALVKFVSTDGKMNVFSVLKSLKGNKLPATIKVPVVSHVESDMVTLKPNLSYLLFLKSNPMTARLGVYSLAMQGLSAKHVGERMLPKYEEVIADYIAYSGDRARLAQRLLVHADVQDNFLQYSAVRDLTTIVPPSQANAQALAQKLKAGLIKSPEAKMDIVEGITRYKLVGFTSTLEGLIINSKETVSVRGASLQSLERMGQTEAIARVAPIALGDQSGRLRRIGIEVVKPR